MENLIITLSLIVCLAVIPNTKSFAQTNEDAISGEWLSSKKDTRFQIYREKNKYFGKILWGSGKDTLDTKNPDPKLRRRKVIGMTILRDFVFEGQGTWDEGRIYDPREGKTYSCKITLKSADQINVRGYIGLSLFGRTDVWTRIKN